MLKIALGAALALAALTGGASAQTANKKKGDFILQKFASRPLNKTRCQPLVMTVLFVCHFGGRIGDFQTNHGSDGVRRFFRQRE